MLKTIIKSVWDREVAQQLSGPEALERHGFSSVPAITVRGFLAWGLSEVGEFEEAEQALSQAHLLLADLDEPTKAAAYVLGCEIRSLAYRGQWAACARDGRAMRASLHKRGGEREQARISLGLGRAILESRRLGTSPYAGEWQEAEAALAEATEIFGGSLSPQVGIQTRVLWGSLCLCQGRLADALRLLAESRQMVELWPKTAPLMGHLQWLEAQVAAASGVWAEALQWFEAACKTWGDSGLRWYCARVRLDWAQAHVSRGLPGDRQRAADLLREAQQAFQDMGVPRYAAIAQERLQELGSEQA